MIANRSDVADVMSVIQDAVREKVRRDVEEAVKQAVAAAAEDLQRRIPEIVSAVALQISGRLDMYTQSNIVTIKFNDPSKKLEV